jgi:hypothetical protein
MGALNMGLLGRNFKQAEGGGAKAKQKKQKAEKMGEEEEAVCGAGLSEPDEDY